MTKPKLTVIKRKVGVICRTREDFNQWLFKEGKTLEDAVYYDDPERLAGIVISGVVLVDIAEDDPAYVIMIAKARSMVRQDEAPPPLGTVAAGQVSTAARPIYPLELRSEAAWMLKTNNHALVAHALLLQRVADAFEALETANVDLQAKVTKLETEKTELASEVPADTRH